MKKIVIILMIAISKISYAQENHPDKGIAYEELLYELELNEEE